MIATAVLAATLLKEVAVPAATFVDSIDVVTHFTYWDTPYGKRFDEVARRLIALGVKHVRDGVAPGQTTACAHERMLAAHGIHFDYVTQPTLRASDLVAWAACVGPAIESFEGLNEYDLSHPASEHAWAQTVRTFQKTLYDAVKSNASLRTFPVIGPSLTTGSAYREAGDLSAYLDFGNMHNYFAGHEPGTGGWGLGGYGSIAYNLGLAHAVSGSKPMVATETGYETDAGPRFVSEAVAAAYEPRIFLDQFAAGVVRTDQYELLDEGPEGDAHFGLLRHDLSPKPSYFALQTFVGLLADAGPPRHDTLRYRLESSGGDLRHALFEKHDGRFYLALWVERPTVEPHTHIAFPLPTVTVNVRFANDTSARVFTYGADQMLHASPRARGHATVALADRVAVVEIAP